MSNASTEICPFCSKLMQYSQSWNDWYCTDRKCRSNLFIPGNRVIHRYRKKLGLGLIIREVSTDFMFNQKPLILSKKKNKKDNQQDILNINENIKINQRKRTKIKKENNNRKPQNDENDFVFLVRFDVYVDQSENLFYPNELKHKLWDINEKVRTKKDIGTIVNRNLMTSDGIIRYDIITSEGKTISIAEKEIIGTYKSPLDEFIRGRIYPTRQFLLHIWARHFLDLYKSDSLKVVTNSRLRLLPHQIGVAHRLLESTPTRVILADEVGLGKTIEAGIFIKELLARQLINRILIITPASLIGQWEFELNNKFNLKFTRLSAKRLKNSQLNIRSGCLQDKNTGEDYRFCTATLQYARLTLGQDMLPKVHWDIVIFDEAHHLRRYLTNQKNGTFRSTLAYELAENLAKNCTHLLLLTATPIQLHSFDLFSLLQLLDPYRFSQFDEFEILRRELPILNAAVRNLQNFTRINSYERKALVYQIHQFLPKFSPETIDRKLGNRLWRKKIIPELEKKHFLSNYIIRNRRRIVFPNNPIKRIPNLVKVSLSDKELFVYNKIHQYLARIYSENYINGPAGLGFVMVILQKLLTSSRPAILKSLKHRIEYLKENKDMLLKLQAENETEREFFDDESSLDSAWGFEDFDLEDRLIIQARKRKQKPKSKNGKTLNIHDHINILKEFVKDLEELTYDSKAEKLLDVIRQIMHQNDEEKVIIFTQFKQTLYYLRDLLKRNGYSVVEFHGGLNEERKNKAVSSFKYKSQIMISTEIGGEGRNFQFCHIMVNYDLPWNPMRLEQRIGRLDRIGQTQNVIIFNFFIQDTIESSIIHAIADRIQLFEESIGVLEPILGSLERQITDLVLKKDTEPLKFRVDEVINKNQEKIDEIFAKLDDFILDRRSFQLQNIQNDIKKLKTQPHKDLLYLLTILSDYFMKLKNQKLSKYMIELNNSMKINEYQVKSNTNLRLDEQFNFSITQSNLEHFKKNSVWKINFTSYMERLWCSSGRNFLGTFSLDTALEEEELDFFAMGHPLIMNILNYLENEKFEGFSTIIKLKTGKLGLEFNNFAESHNLKWTKEEYSILARIFEPSPDQNIILNEQLFLFVFELEFLGIIAEHVPVYIILTKTGEYLPIFSEYVSHAHNWEKIWDSNSNFQIDNNVNFLSNPYYLIKKIGIEKAIINKNEDFNKNPNLNIENANNKQSDNQNNNKNIDNNYNKDNGFLKKDKNNYRLENLKYLFEIAKNILKKHSNNEIQEYIEKNKKKYENLLIKTKQMAKYKKKYINQRIEDIKQTLKIWQLKIPSNIQISTQSNSLTLQKNKNNKKIKTKTQIKKEIQIQKINTRIAQLKYELSLWEKKLEELEFDIPETLKRLKKHKKLLINANFLGFAILYSGDMEY